jgi:hypothetical protein
MSKPPFQDLVDCIRSLAAADDLLGPPDAVLLDRFRSRRDEAAFEPLVRRHSPVLLAACRRILADPHDSEDAFQATVLVRNAHALAKIAQAQSAAGDEQGALALAEAQPSPSLKVSALTGIARARLKQKPAQE